MTKNRFFLREEYNFDEKISRITAREFTINNPPVLEIIDDTPITPENISEIGKEEFLNIVRSEVGRDEYGEFIDHMFRRYGKSGDQFNQQLVRYPPDLDTVDLYEKMTKYKDGPLAKPFDFILTQPLFMNELKYSENQIDISFYTAADFTEYESEEDIPIHILDEEGEEIQTLGPSQKVSVPIRRRVEVRVYLEERIISISNSEVPNRLQKEIYNIILAIARESPQINDEEI